MTGLESRLDGTGSVSGTADMNHDELPEIKKENQ